MVLPKFPTIESKEIIVARSSPSISSWKKACLMGCITPKQPVYTNNPQARPYPKSTKKNIKDCDGKNLSKIMESLSGFIDGSKFVIKKICEERENLLKMGRRESSPKQNY